MTPIFFDHTPKAGGMSLVRVFEDIVGKSAVLHVNGQHAGAVCSHSVDIPVVSGHFFFTPGEALPADRFCLTMLREPLDRVLSNYYFSRNNASTTLAANVKFAQSMELEEYIECEDFEIRSDVSNAQTNHFYPLIWSASGKPDNEQKLSSAKLALEQFHLVGVLEQYQDFVDVLCYEQGWPPVLKVPLENTTLRRQKVPELPSHVLARLRALNELDIELYEHARQLFHSHRRRIMVACIERRSANGSGKVAELTGALKADSLRSVQSAPLSSKEVDFGDHGAEIVSVDLLGDLIASPQLLAGESFVCREIFKANEDIPDLTVGIYIRDEQGRLVFGTNSRLHGSKLSVTKGAEYFVDFAARCDLGMAKYTVGAALHPGTSHLQRCFHWRESVAGFEVIGQLGYHSVGAFKLHPTLSYGPLDPTKGILEAEQAIESNGGFQLLAHHTAALPEFSASIKALTAEPITVAAGQVFEIEVEVSNTSQCNWPSIGMRAVCISYHWLDSAGSMLVYDGKRTPLLRDVSPAATVHMWASIIAPEQTGDAHLQLTLVQEHVGWFDERGCPPAEIEVMVETVDRAL